MSDIEDLIQHVLDDDLNKAGNVFNDLLASKQSDALDQEKISIAADIFNGGVETSSEADDELEDDEDFDLDDIDLDDIDLDDIDLDDIDLDDIEEQE